MLTEERKRELDAKLAAIFKPKPTPPKPKVVVSDGVPIRDADVIVSGADPNARRGETEVVSVRRVDRFDRVTINHGEADRRYWDGVNAQQTEAHARQALRVADDMNVWGSKDD
jgi:hypothetical protein